MTRTEIFEKKQQEMSDEKLIELSYKEISKLCKTGGKSLTMCIPPMVTDTDMLLCELIRRYQNLLSDKMCEGLDGSNLEKPFF